MENDPETGAIALCAVRYCMGRTTYMPGLVTDWMRRHWNELPPRDRFNIQRDVKDFVEGGQSMGDSCDVDTWQSFLRWMQAQQVEAQ